MNCMGDDIHCFTAQGGRNGGWGLAGIGNLAADEHGFIEAGDWKSDAEVEQAVGAGQRKLPIPLDSGVTPPGVIVQ